QVGLVQRDLAGEVFDPLEVLGARPPDDAVDFVTFGEQQVREVAAVLAGDARNERALHNVFSGLQTNRRISGVSSGNGCTLSIRTRDGATSSREYESGEAHHSVCGCPRVGGSEQCERIDSPGRKRMPANLAGSHPGASRHGWPPSSAARVACTYS